MSFTFDNLAAYLLVFTRMGGMIFFNPMLSRRNLPGQARVALVLGLTLLLAPNQAENAAAYVTSFALIFGMIRELMVGFLCGFVFHVFYYLLFFAGDMMDMQFGLSMAKAFDPGTNIQLSVSGNLLNILFALYFFVTDSHLLLIRIFATSYEIIPLGASGITPHLAGFALNLFISAFSLMIRLTLPFIAAEFIAEVSMGVLMKLIPQIHVFVINIQLKLLLGFVLLIALASPVSMFMDQYTATMMQNIENALYACVA